MPQLAPRVLKDAANVDHTFDVSTFNGTRASFTEMAVSRLADRPVLIETTRTAAKGNNGHKLVVNLSLPHPTVDQAGCCVDKDEPPISYVNIDTLLSKFATAAQADDVVALIRSYVSSSAFAALVKGGSNY